MHLPAIVSDLAVILLTASVLMLLCRALHLPTMLGLIGAGFLLGPLFPPLTLADPEAFSSWSELGTVVLLFALGLDFYLPSLAKIRRGVSITALLLIAGSMALGLLAGGLLHYSLLDRLIFGGMLGMNTATIVIKAAEEHDMKKTAAGRTVFGVLMAEDIAALVLMTALEHLAAPGGSSPLAFAKELGVQFLWLAAWILLGIWLLPHLLKVLEKLLDDEITLLIALGLCFAMVVLSHHLGFSALLGAFLAGAFLAGTKHAEHIAQLIHGVEELFGAIVHISVGYMLSPEILRAHLWKILALSLLVLCAKTLLGAIGLRLSGFDARSSFRGGCLLAQVGEVAFLIAAVGRSLGVMNEEVYSVTVGISVFTTLATPLWLRGADRLAEHARKYAPAPFRRVR